MNNNSEIRAKVTSKVNVIIKALKPDVDLNEPLFAINWFSTKAEWLYHFYNFLAVKSVVKVGGRGFFKAKIVETLIDDSNAGRELLLIVRYPNALKFKSLMESAYFKFVSIFRMMAVEKFTFGFTHKRVVDESSMLEDDLHYAIHHYKSDQDNWLEITLIQDKLPASISIKYFGEMVATLNSQSRGKLMDQIPNLMDGLVIYQSSKQNDLREFLMSDSYKKILGLCDSSFVSLIKRIAV